MSTTAPVAGSTVLTLRGVSKSFGAVAALTQVDLEVAAGEVVAVVGDNGAGESTLVKMLAGGHDADSGTIPFAGRPVRISSREPAQNLGDATELQYLGTRG